VPAASVPHLELRIKPRPKQGVAGGLARSSLREPITTQDRSHLGSGCPRDRLTIAHENRASARPSDHSANANQLGMRPSNRWRNE
jgi:hypothetical protein